MFNQGVRKVVTLDSRDCFAVDTSEIGMEHFRSTTSLAYELEQYLPLDAERMAIAIGPTPMRSKVRTNHGLVVVVDRAPVQERVSELELQGSWIAGVSPKFLIASQWWANEYGVIEGYILCRDGSEDVWDLLRIESECPKQWQWLSTASVKSTLLCDTTQTPIHIVGPISEDMQSFIAELGSRVHCHEEMDIEKAISIAEEKWCNGNWSPWIDLRGRSIETRFRYAPLYPSLLATTTALLLFLAVSICQLLLQTYQLEKTIANNDSASYEVFRKLYPVQSVPADIPGRLGSELRKLNLARDEMSKEPPVYSSYPVLMQFLSRLPDESVFRVDSIRVKSDQITSVDGAARTLSDLESITQALRTGGFVFPPPSSTGMNEGFSIRLEQLKLSKSSAVAEEAIKQ
jgi:hypothetical protein